MKKMMVLIMGVLLLGLAGNALALKAWEFSLWEYSGGTSYSVTTAKNVAGLQANNGVVSYPVQSSGVSIMARTAGTVPKALVQDPFAIDIRDTKGIFEVSVVTLAASGSSPYISNTTGFWVAQVAQANTPAGWAAAQYIQAFEVTAPNSGTTLLTGYFKVPPANYLRASFIPSGATAFGVGKIRIAEAKEAWEPPLQKLEWEGLSDANGFWQAGVSLEFTGYPIAMRATPDLTQQPTDAYDVEILDDKGTDIMHTNGANCSNTVPSDYTPLTTTGGYEYLDRRKVAPRIQNAGNGKKFKVELWVK